MNRKKLVTTTILPLLAIVVSITVPQAYAETTEHNMANAYVKYTMFDYEGVYNAFVVIQSGSEELGSGTLLVTSDTVSKTVDFDKPKTASWHKVTVNIAANDPSSIDVKIVDKQEKKMSPTISVIDNTPIYGSDWYLATVKIDARGYDMQNVVIEVSSDWQTYQTRASGSSGNQNASYIDSGTSDITNVIVLAGDPSTISAKIVDYDKV